jgi:hypothetical protein
MRVMPEPVADCATDCDAQHRKLSKRNVEFRPRKVKGACQRRAFGTQWRGGNRYHNDVLAGSNKLDPALPLVYQAVGPIESFRNLDAIPRG